MKKYALKMRKIIDHITIEIYRNQAANYLTFGIRLVEIYIFTNQNYNNNRENRARGQNLFNSNSKNQ